MCPRTFDAQVLFDPFEEQLHTPSVMVKLGDCLSRRRQIVGQKDVSGAVLRVDADYLPELFRIIPLLFRFINPGTARSGKQTIGWNPDLEKAADSFGNITDI